MTLRPRFDPYRAAMVPSVIPLAKAAEPAEMPPVVYTLLGVPYTVVPDRRYGFLFKAARRKPAPGQMSFFDAPKAPKAPGTGGRKKMQEGATRMKNGQQQVLKNSRWRNVEPKGKATPKPGLSIIPDGTPSKVKPKTRKGKEWQSSSPAKAPAAVGGEAMGTTTLRPKAKPPLPMPSVLGDEDIFEDNAPATSSTLKPKGESKKSTSPQYKLGPSETTPYLVDVSGITSTVPRSAFDADQVESLAQSILESGGLLSPIVLKQTGPESFEVLAGDLEYHAAARAKELDPRKGEMVNAYVVPPQNQAAAVEQVNRAKPTVRPKKGDSTSPQYKLGPSETKHYLVDVSGITSTVPRSAFGADQVESLAQSILESGGLLSPIVLKQTGPESFEVLAGDLEYHAAARAKELDPRKGEMVNAYVVPPQHQAAAVAQVTPATPVAAEVVADDEPTTLRPKVRSRAERSQSFDRVKKTMQEAARGAIRAGAEVADFYEGTVAAVADGLGVGEDVGEVGGNRAKTEAMLAERDPLQVEPTTLRPKRTRAERKQDFDQIKQNLYGAGVSTVRAAQSVQQMGDTAAGAVADAYGLDLDDNAGLGDTNAPQLEPTLGDMLSEQKAIADNESPLRPKSKSSLAVKDDKAIQKERQTVESAISQGKNPELYLAKLFSAHSSAIAERHKAEIALSGGKETPELISDAHNRYLEQMNEPSHLARHYRQEYAKTTDNQDYIEASKQWSETESYTIPKDFSASKASEYVLTAYPGVFKSKAEIQRFINAAIDKGEIEATGTGSFKVNYMKHEYGNNSGTGTKDRSYTKYSRESVDLLVSERLKTSLSAKQRDRKR